jgi:hypothetical protein
MMEVGRGRARVLAERDSAGARVTLRWLEGTQEVWLELRDPARQDPLVVAVEPERALDAFRHPYAYASRGVSAAERMAA